MNDLDSLQEQAVRRAVAADGFGFFPEPRVGKTRMALEVVNRCLDIEMVIVVCPLSLHGVWASAVNTDLHRSVNYKIVNYEWFNNLKNYKSLRRTLSGQFCMMILDEAHRIKKRGNKQSRRLRLLGRLCRCRLALTGTPIAQGIHDAWAIFDFLDPAIFGKWSFFEDRYCVMGGFRGRKIIGHKNEDEFKRIMHEHSARIRLTEVADRPVRVRRTVVSLEMPKRLASIYHRLEEDLMVEAMRMRVEAPLVITMATRLQQLAGGYLSDGNTIKRVDTTKLSWLATNLSRSTSTVIVCRYLHEIDAIDSRLIEYGFSVIVIHGGKPLVEPFTADVAIIQTSAGVGIDLSHAKTVVFYSWDYSYINFEQMRFRILSRTNTTARYVFLMMANSIDELIYEACTKKKKLSTLICDHYRSSTHGSANQRS